MFWRNDESPNNERRGSFGREGNDGLNCEMVLAIIVNVPDPLLVPELTVIWKSPGIAVAGNKTEISDSVQASTMSDTVAPPPAGIMVTVPGVVGKPPRPADMRSTLLPGVAGLGAAANSSPAGGLVPSAPMVVIGRES